MQAQDGWAGMTLKCTRCAAPLIVPGHNLPTAKPAAQPYVIAVIAAIVLVVFLFLALAMLAIVLLFV